MTTTTDQTFQLVPFDLLVPADDNVRDEIGDVTDLADSILFNGLISPLTVHPIEDGRFRIIAGHRRHAALCQIREGSKKRYPEVPCMVRATIDDQSRVAAMLVENLQRSDLNPIEEAKAFLRLTKEFGYKRDDLAAHIGRSVQHVSTRISLLGLPDEAQAMVVNKALTLEMALALTKVKDDAKIRKLIAKGVPRQHEIDDAVKQVQVDTIMAQFRRKLDALEVPVSDERPPFNRVTTLDTTNPKDLDELVKIPKHAKAYLSPNVHGGTVRLFICREMTDAEIAKQAAKAQAEREKQNAEWQAAQEAKLLAERESWSPEFKAWKNECAKIDETNRAGGAAVIEAERLALLRWAKAFDAKAAAKQAMITIVTEYGQADDLAWLFGLETNGSWAEQRDAVYAHIAESPANLVAAVTFTLAHEGHAFEEDYQVVAKSVDRYQTIPYPEYTGEAKEEAAA